MPTGQWRAVLGVVLDAPFYLSRAVVPHMIAAGWGRIISVSGLAALSTGSVIGSIRNVAVSAMTKNLADELGPSGVNVNAVHPGPIVTPMTEARRGDPASYRLTVSRIPLGRYGEPEDVAYGVLYLASDESSFMTGAELVIDGGLTVKCY